MNETESQLKWDEQLARGTALVVEIRAEADACDDPKRRRMLRFQATRLETDMRKTRELVEALKPAEVTT